MRSHREAGSVLAADLVLASLIVLLITATTAAFGGIAGAVQADREAARNAAVIAARTGDLTRAADVAHRLAPGATVVIDASPDAVTVSVRGPVEVAHPVRGRVTVRAFGEFEVPVAPYRSNRG